MILDNVAMDMRVELTPQKRELVERNALGICYDRHMCRVLGVDYNTLSEDDIAKIYRFVIADCLQAAA